jgi:hypothetical protein
MKHVRTTAILIGLAVYLIAFYLTPLPSFARDDGEPFLRFHLVLVVLFEPYRWLFSSWFGAPPQFSFSDRLPILLAAGLILAWAAALGWLLLAALRADRRLTRLETAVFSTVVGLNALSTWTLLLGLFGQLSRTWTFVVPSLLTFAAAAWLWHHRSRSNSHDNNHNSRGPTARGATPPQDDTSVDAILDPRWLWLGLPFVLAILLAAMLPATEFDVCEYHLQAPKEFFQQGQITFLPHNVYANMPLGAEMLSLLAMVFTGDWWVGALVGKTVIAAFTPLCALALLAAGTRFFSQRAGIVAALVYISIPWLGSTAIPYVVNVSSSGLIEGVSACYLFLALYALLLSRDADATSPLPSAATPPKQRGASLPQKPDRKSRAMVFVALAGYLAGGAVATKYPAVLFVLVPLAAWTLVERLWRTKRDADSDGTRRPMGSAFAALTVFLLASAIGCGLWFAKNWVLTDNPTYPLLYEVFDGKTWNAEKEQRWNRVHRPHDFSATALGKGLGDVLLTSEWISPLIAPLAMLAFFGWGKRPRSHAATMLRWELLAYVAFIVAVWWLFTHRIDRFWLPMLPVAALLAGAGACWSCEHWWTVVLKALLAVGLAANFLLSSAGAPNAWFVPLDQLRNDTRWIGPWHWNLNNRPSRGKTLAVGDAAVFDLTAPVLYNTCFDDCVFEQLVKGKTADEIRAEFASRHIDRVYVNWGEIARYRSPGNYGFTDFVQPAVFDRLVKQGVLELEESNPELRGQVYRVKPSPPNPTNHPSPSSLLWQAGRKSARMTTSMGRMGTKDVVLATSAMDG